MNTLNRLQFCEYTTVSSYHHNCCRGLIKLALSLEACLFYVLLYILLFMDLLLIWI